jgi:hypothetical protein
MELRQVIVFATNLDFEELLADNLHVYYSVDCQDDRQYFILESFTSQIKTEGRENEAETWKLR